MKAQSYLCMSGVEIANSNRTLTYLRRGYAGNRFNVILGRAPVAPFPNPADLACYCSAFSEVAYGSPSSDPAPWYDATRTDSAEFLGLYVGVELPSVLQRSVTELTNGGATVGRLRPKSRLVVVQGTMYATGERGLAYGERWLTEALAGSLCRDDCASDELELLLACDSTLFRRVLRAGILDGPVFSNVLPGCVAQNVAFQISGGQPELFSRPTTCLNETTVKNTTDCCLLTAPDWPGDLTSRIQLTAPDAGAVTGITITLTPTSGVSCPDTNYSPAVSVTVASLPASHRLTIDSRTRTVTVRDPSTRQEVSGFYLLDFDGPFQWFDVDPCAKACLCVAVAASSPQDLTTLVETYNREL